MTKHEVRSLEERVHRLDEKPEESTAHYEADARMQWLILHLTEDERIHLSRFIAKLEHDELDKTTQEEAQQLQRRAEQRVGAESSQAWQDFRDHFIEREKILRLNRCLTESESVKLDSLNEWWGSLQKSMGEIV